MITNLKNLKHSQGFPKTINRFKSSVSYSDYSFNHKKYNFLLNYTSKYKFKQVTIYNNKLLDLRIKLHNNQFFRNLFQPKPLASDTLLKQSKKTAPTVFESNINVVPIYTDHQLFYFCSFNNLLNSNACKYKTMFHRTVDLNFLKHNPCFATKLPATLGCIWYNSHKLHNLKNSTYLTCFKKGLYNRLKVRDGRLSPFYNRKKHNLSHYSLIDNVQTKLSKTYNYISRKKIHSYIGLALLKAYNKGVHSPVLNNLSQPNGAQAHSKTVPLLMGLLENQPRLYMYKTLFACSLKSSLKYNLKTSV